MKFYVSAAAGAALLLLTASAGGAADGALTKPDGLDYRLVGHLPNYEASPAPPPQKSLNDLTRYAVLTGPVSYEQKAARMDTFRVRRSDIGGPDVTADGKKYAVVYRPRAGGAGNTSDQIHRVYRGAFQALGADIVYADAINTVALLEEGRRQVWMKIEGGGPEYVLTAVEERDYGDLRPVFDRTALKEALERDGHAPLYIDFVRHRAVPAPEAARLIDEVVALLREQQKLKLIVAGYTDDIGDAETNSKLSAERAHAVVAALIARGVSDARLKAEGRGDDDPVGDNDRSSGRAVNRRVEIIKDE